MAIKYFQIVETSDSKTKTEKLVKGLTLKSFYLKDNKVLPLDASIASIEMSINNEPWQGLKISYNGGYIFTTVEQALLTENKTIKLANEIKLNDKLMGTDFKAKTVTKIESGKVLCGKCTVVLEDNNKQQLGFYHSLNDILVGDEIVNQNQKANQNLGLINDDFLYPKNPIIRVIKTMILPKKSNYQ